jgi:hypothetical protein
MSKLGSLSGIGALLLDGDPIAKAEYEIVVNQDDAGRKLAFGWMRISKHAIGLIDVSTGNYSLELQDSRRVELVLGEAAENVINFDVSGPVPGF